MNGVSLFFLFVRVMIRISKLRNISGVHNTHSFLHAPQNSRHHNKTICYKGLLTTSIVFVLLDWKMSYVSIIFLYTFLSSRISFFIKKMTWVFHFPTSNAIWWFSWFADNLIGRNQGNHSKYVTSCVLNCSLNELSLCILHKHSVLIMCMYIICYTC